MAMVKLGRNHLRWCLSCNLPIMEARRCPVCGRGTEETALTPPADSRPAFDFDVRRVRSLCDATFGDGTGEALIPEGHLAVMNKAPAIDRMDEVLCDGAVVATLRYDLGAGWRFIVRMQGAMRIAVAMTKGWVVCAEEAVQFVRENKNLMAPGIIDADPGIAPEDEVVIITSDRRVVGTGTAKMSGKDMRGMDHGIGVKTRKHKEETPVSSDVGHTWQDAVEANRGVIESRRDEAASFIADTMNKYDLPAVVSFSGGKDSLATMLLAMDAGADVKPMFVNTGLELEETVQYVRDFAERHGLELIEQDAPENAFWDNLECFGPPAKDFRWCCKTNKLGPTVAAITQHFPDGVLSFIGQRKYESEARNAKPRVWRNPWTPGQVGASPIQSWSAMHVWLYIFCKKEPFNPWYARGLDRIGCFMCPASDEGDHDMVSQTSRYPQWEACLERYREANGLPEEYTKYGLWRWKSPPRSVKDEILRVTGKEVPPMAVTKKEGLGGPVSVKVQDGYSPCAFGYSIEAALSRPIDLKVLKPFTHALGWVIRYDEENDTIQANYVTFYGAGSITSKASVERDAERQMDQAIQLIARAFNCVGCGLCAARCTPKALYMENGRVHIREDECIFCMDCYGKCPAVTFAPGSRITLPEEKGADADDP